MASGDLITRIASQDTLLSVKDELDRVANVILDASKMDFKSLFEARRTGEVFSTKFYTYETSTSPAGTKMNASVGLKATPSTETVKGRDDFAVRNAFTTIDCNFTCNDAGKRIVSKISGQSGFSRTGKVDVGVLVPQTYWGIEEHYSEGYYIVHFSDAPHPELGLVSTPWCNDPNGNAMGYGILTKYYAGEIDGVLYSSSGLAPKGFVSYESGHSLLQKKGTGYYGSGSERTAYLLCMLWIKYATKNSQTVFPGCSNYNVQVKVAEATTGKNYVVIPTSSANNLAVRGCVSIGDTGQTSSATDRGDAKTYNIKNRVRIAKIEAISGTANSRVYLDTGTFNATATTWLSTEPLWSGETDNILGVDGYVKNDGKHSFKLGGIEDMIGAYFVSMNEIWKKDTGTTVSYYVRGNATWNNTASGYKKVGTLNMGNSTDQWIGDVTIDVNTGVHYPRVYGSGDSVGVGDMQYKGGGDSGLREALQRGVLGHGSGAGLSFANLWYGLGGAFWLCALAV